MMFESDRIRLRALEPEDLDWLYKVENNDELWKYGNSNVPYSKYVLKQYIAENHSDLYADGQLRLVAVDKDTEHVVGCVDLVNFTPRHMRAELGIFIFPEYQGQGLAQETLHLICAYARDFMFLHQIYAFVAESNEKACRLFQRCGFVHQSTINEWLRTSTDEYMDARIYVRVL